MLSYSKLSRMGSTFRSFTGLGVSESDSFCKRIEPDYEGSARRSLSRPDRETDVGGGGMLQASSPPGTGS